LNNSFYHGKAKEVFINLHFSTNELKLYITDDGEGCSNIIKSRGLTGIEERVRYSGGKVDFGSPSDGGFNIRISLPYGPDKQRVKTGRGGKKGSCAQSIDS
jgi:signal transduction histidine kinase